MTFGELVKGLNIILGNHPELSEREIGHRSECGCWSTGFESPVEIAVPVLDMHYRDEDFAIYIVSDDDGYRTSEAIIDWKFFSSKKDSG